MRITLSLMFAAVLLLQTATRAAAAEPTLDDVRRVALKYSGLHHRLDRWSTRARLRHLLPEVTVTAGQTEQADDNIQFDEWLVRDGGDELLWDSARNQNEDNHRLRTDYTIRATIDVRGLIFDNLELAAARESRAQFEARLELFDAVHEAYFGRLAALDALRHVAPDDEPSRRAHAMRIAVLDGRLDSLTGGWFSRQLQGAP